MSKTLAHVRDSVFRIFKDPKKTGLCWSRARGKVHDRIEKKKGTGKNKCNVAEENRKIKGEKTRDKAEKRQQYARKIEIP